jgi:hypothetical protein
MKISFLFLISVVFGCQEPQRNCKDFKTGKFSYTQEINGKKEVSTFERLEKIQIENYKGKKDTTNIRWINDCEYILQKINPKNMLEKKAIHFKILTTQDNSYTFEYSFVGNTEKSRGTVRKLN